MRNHRGYLMFGLAMLAAGMNDNHQEDSYRRSRPEPTKSRKEPLSKRQVKNRLKSKAAKKSRRANR